MKINEKEMDKKFFVFNQREIVYSLRGTRVKINLIYDSRLFQFHMHVINSFTTKKQTIKFSSANFQKM